MTEKGQIITCRNCGSKNRVRPAGQRTPICGKCKQPLMIAASPVIVTDQNFNELVEQSKVPVLLDLWATWCPPCRMLAPIIEDLASELAGKVVIGKLDVDKNQATAGRFQVQSIPTMLIFTGGRESERIVGLQSKEAILLRLKKYI